MVVDSTTCAGSVVVVGRTGGEVGLTGSDVVVVGAIVVVVEVVVVDVVVGGSV